MIFQNSDLKHIAFIMDGNGRWAESRGLKRLEGHKQGVETLREIVEVAPSLNVRTVTFYAFSTENWKRNEEEVKGLFKLMHFFFDKYLSRLKADGVRIRVLGDKGYGSKLDDDIKELIAHVELETEKCSVLNMNICINYGGRDEIIRAAQTFAEDVEKGERFSTDLDEDMFASYLDSKGQDSPDLMIRTGGEQRISNFLLWQLAYSELMFTETHWPDFTADELKNIIEKFNSVDRRFGSINAYDATTENNAAQTLQTTTNLNDEVDAF